MTVMVTKSPPYPANKRVSLAEAKAWPPGLRAKRTCQVCQRVYLHAGAAYTCEHSPHPGLTLP